MPRARKPFHMYSVFVSTRTPEGVMRSEMVYFESNERAAQLAFARAVMHNPHAYAVEIHVDVRLLVRVHIERPKP